MNWAVFELSTAEIEDRTTYNLQLEHPDHPDVRLVVWHVQVPIGKTVRELAARRVAEEMARLDGYTILEQREVAWRETPAIEISSRWRHAGAVYYQTQAHFAPDDTLRSFSLAGPIASRAACDAWFEDIRASIRMRS